MNGYDDERAGFDLELALDIPISNVDMVSRLIGMGKIGFICMLIILELAAAVVLIDKFPVCQVSGTDNHISVKCNLYRGGSENGMVSCTKAKSSGLEDSIDFVIRWRVGVAFKVLGTDVVINGEGNVYADCIGLRILYGGGLGVNAINDDMARAGVSTEPFPVNNQADVLRTLTGQWVKFWPPCACINHVDGKNGSGFLVLGLDSPRTKEIDLHCIPWFQLVESKEDLCNGFVSPSCTGMSKVYMVPISNSGGKGRGSPVFWVLDVSGFVGKLGLLDCTVLNSEVVFNLKSIHFCNVGRREGD
eukprot:15347563-Ditylum_brightwellii.AAC.1